MASRRKRNPLARPPLPAAPEPPALRPRWLWPVAAGVALVLVGASGFVLGQSVGGDDAAPAAESAPVLAADGTLRQPVHEHLDYAVVVRGQPLEFDAPEYLSTEDTDLSPNVHVHAPRTNVVHIHREQTTWDEFFRSLGMSISDTCLGLRDGTEYCTEGTESLKFFVNGVQVDSLRLENLADLGRVLISFGSEDAPALESQIASVTDEACIPSENCEARIDPNNPEVEPCRKSETTCVG